MEVAVTFSTFYIEGILKIRTPSLFYHLGRFGNFKRRVCIYDMQALTGVREYAFLNWMHEKNKLSICSGILIARMFLRKWRYKCWTESDLFKITSPKRSPRHNIWEFWYSMSFTVYKLPFDSSKSNVNFVGDWIPDTRTSPVSTCDIDGFIHPTLSIYNDSFPAP